MKSTNLCPQLQKSMNIIGRRWSALIIYQLLQGPQRFSTIEASLPISGRLLSERLKELELEGIVLREVFPETPVRIQYSLTNKGLALKTVIRDLEQWSKVWVNCESANMDSEAPKI